MTAGNRSAAWPEPERRAANHPLPGRRAWAEIDLDALAANYHTLQAHPGREGELVAVIKADAYGHGAGPVALRLAREGATRFGVALVEEGIALRREGLAGTILILGGVRPDQIGPCLEWDLTPAVATEAALTALGDRCRAAGKALPFHLKVDTGMGRLGLPAEAAAQILEGRDLGPGRLEGLFAALSCADELDAVGAAHTRRQVERLHQAGAALRHRGFAPVLHSSNSASLLRSLTPGFQWTRAGLALYGVSPLEADSPVPTGAAAGLRPVMRFAARLCQVQTRPPGTPIGYGADYVTPRECRIATLPVGYADGVDRRLGNRGTVLLEGTPVPVVGRVSMDLTTLDVTGVPEAQVGRPAEFWGPGQAVETVARTVGTIPYELLTGVGPRVPRVYREAGEVVGIAGRLSGADPGVEP